MGRLLRGFGTFLLSLWILKIFEMLRLPLGTLAALILVALLVYVIVFPDKSIVGTTTRTIKQERIINFHDNSQEEIFIPSRYPDYKKERSGTDGNDYISSTGGVICTKYVTSNETVKTVSDNSIIKHIFCIILTLITVFYWNRNVPVNDFIQKFLPMQRSVEFDYTGYFVDEAEHALRMNGWQVETTPDYDGTLKAGMILGQNIDIDENLVTLYVNQGLYLDETLRRVGVFIDCNVSEVNLAQGEVYNLNYYCYGDLPDHYYLRGTTVPDIIGSWGDWIDGNTATLEIEGVSASQGYLRIFLYDSGTDELLAYSDVYVVVE